jgi:ACT domain-containing protein
MYGEGGIYYKYKNLIYNLNGAVIIQIIAFFLYIYKKTLLFILR